MRKPKVKNKYNLTIGKIKKLKFNRAKIGEPIFWRNDVIDAWCISKTTAKNSADMEFCTYNSFWMGIYDENAKSYSNKLRIDVSSYGGMCSYKFEKFYGPKDIEHEVDLEIQEIILKTINELIDKKILLLN
jgi:hypothetical protein